MADSSWDNVSKDLVAGLHPKGSGQRRIVSLTGKSLMEAEGVQLSSDLSTEYLSTDPKQ